MEEEGKVPCQPQNLRLWKLVQGIMSVFFVLAAVAQYNDPDPYVWIPYYCAPLVLTFSLLVAPSVKETSLLWSYMSLLFIVMSCCWLVLLTWAFISALEGKAVANPLVLEEGRELSGVALSVAWISLLRFSNMCSGSKGEAASMSKIHVISLLVVSFPLAIWLVCYTTLGSYLSYCSAMCGRDANT